MEQQTKKQNQVTIIFAILNIIAYIIYTILGEIVYNIGSLSAVDIIERQEYYRILMCMFLHADVEHLIGNMLFVVILGEMLEQAVGHIRFAGIYLVTGIVSGLFSIGYELITNSFYHSVGASGAACGLMGALLVLVIQNHGYYKEISLRRMLIAIVYLIYTGLQSPVVNNAAHIGGLITGIFMMWILSLCGIHRNRKVPNN